MDLSLPDLAAIQEAHERIRGLIARGVAAATIDAQAARVDGVVEVITIGKDSGGR